MRRILYFKIQVRKYSSVKGGGHLGWRQASQVVSVSRGTAMTLGDSGAQGSERRVLAAAGGGQPGSEAAGPASPTRGRPTLPPPAGGRLAGREDAEALRWG